MIPFIKFVSKEAIIESTETAPVSNQHELETYGNPQAPGGGKGGTGGTGGAGGGGGSDPDQKNAHAKLYSVQMFSCCTGDNDYISFWKACYYFHHAPIVKFCYHTVREDL